MPDEPKKRPAPEKDDPGSDPEKPRRDTERGKGAGRKTGTQRRPGDQRQRPDPEEVTDPD